MWNVGNERGERNGEWRNGEHSAANDSDESTVWRSVTVGWRRRDVRRTRRSSRSSWIVGWVCCAESTDSQLFSNRRITKALVHSPQLNSTLHRGLVVKVEKRRKQKREGKEVGSAPKLDLRTPTPAQPGNDARQWCGAAERRGASEPQSEAEDRPEATYSTRCNLGRTESTAVGSGPGVNCKCKLQAHLTLTLAVLHGTNAATLDDWRSVVVHGGELRHHSWLDLARGAGAADSYLFILIPWLQAVTGLAMQPSSRRANT